MSGSPPTAPPPLDTEPNRPASRQGTADKLLRPNRRSPPPPKLNLDDCTSLVTTTTTNTSTNAASKPSTAFVFTSSRTIRTLHNLSHSADDAPLPPLPPVLSPGPASAPEYPTSPESRKHLRSYKAPSLSPAQLARHSVGAFDARCVVSSSMRAAGFVPLPQQRLSDASMPLLSPVPTPADPPRFPPIVFVNPSNVASASLWDYQRTLSYGLPTDNLDSPLHDDDLPKMRPSIHPMSKGKGSDGGSGSSFTLDAASSSSSLFSNPSSSRSSLTSVSPYSQDEVGQKPLIQQLEELTLRDHFSDGYPFPVTPPRSRTLSSRAPSSSQVATLTASPSMSSSTITPTISPVALTTALPHASSNSALGPDATSPSGSQSVSPPRSAPSRRPFSRHASQLSITELCDSPSNVWFTDPGQIVPLGSVVRREPARGRPQTTLSRADLDNRRRVEGRTKTPTGVRAQMEVVEAPGTGEPEVVVEALSTGEPEVEVEVETTPKVVQDLGWIPEEEDEIAIEKKEIQKGKEKERRKHSAKSRTTKSSSPSSIDCSPASTTPSPPCTVAKERFRSKGKGRADRAERSRSTKSKALGPTPTFSTWAATPSSRAVAARPHVLGAPDPVMERERQLEAGQFAKDAVMAHRERDRAYARHSHHSHHVPKMRIASAPTDEYTTVYDASRGRGLGRGERGRGRGRSVSSVAMSVLSDGETMVQSENSSTMDAIEAVLTV